MTGCAKTRIIAAFPPQRKIHAAHSKYVLVNQVNKSELNQMKNVLIAGVVGLALSVAGSAGAEEDKGKTIYDTKCAVCHANGVAGAPKFGDKEAWAPRIATGEEALMTSVVNGKNAMPPKGTCMDCSDADLKAALQYMTSNSK
jgi:cytochrome c5